MDHINGVYISPKADDESYGQEYRDTWSEDDEESEIVADSDAHSNDEQESESESDGNIDSKNTCTKKAGVDVRPNTVKAEQPFAAFPATAPPHQHPPEPTLRPELVRHQAAPLHHNSAQAPAPTPAHQPSPLQHQYHVPLPPQVQHYSAPVHQVHAIQQPYGPPAQSHYLVLAPTPAHQPPPLQQQYHVPLPPQVRHYSAPPVQYHVPLPPQVQHYSAPMAPMAPAPVHQVHAIQQPYGPPAQSHYLVLAPTPGDQVHPIPTTGSKDGSNNSAD